MSNIKLKATEAIQTAWLDGDSEECDVIAKVLAEYLGCSQHRLYTALTNLYPLVLTSADINGNL